MALVGYLLGASEIPPALWLGWSSVGCLFSTPLLSTLLVSTLWGGVYPSPYPALVYPPLSGVVPVCVCVYQKINQKSTKDQPKSTKTRPKIDQKMTKKSPKLNLGGVQGGLGKLLAANTER